MLSIFGELVRVFNGLVIIGYAEEKLKKSTIDVISHQSPQTSELV